MFDKYYITKPKKLMKLLKKINLKLDLIMTKQEQFDAALGKIDAATSDIADDLRRLKEEITNGNVSPESLARLDAAADALDALGKSTPEDEQPTEGGGDTEPTEPTEQ